MAKTEKKKNIRFLSDDPFRLTGTCTEGKIEGKMKSFLVSGVDRVLLSTEEKVIFLCKRNQIVFEGREMICLSFRNGCAEVAGEIASLSFSERDKT